MDDGVLVFDDSFEHEVWNEGGAARPKARGAGLALLDCAPVLGAPHASSAVLPICRELPACGHAGTAPRLIFIIDAWHPELCVHQRLANDRHEAVAQRCVTQTCCHNFSRYHLHGIAEALCQEICDVCVR